jgi:hypothetical protein
VVAIARYLGGDGIKEFPNGFLLEYVCGSSVFALAVWID